MAITDLAWLLLPPIFIAAISVIVLSAPSFGHLAFPRPPLHYWDTPGAVRKPAVQAGYILMVVFAIAYAATIVAVARRGVRVSRSWHRPAVIIIQMLVLAFMVMCWILQPHIEFGGVRRVYFKAPTLVVSAVFALLAYGLGRVHAARELGIAASAARAVANHRLVGRVCVAIAVLATVMWLLPTVYTDQGMSGAPSQLLGDSYAFDEAMAVVDHRSPLVNMVAYGTLWPYVIALPLAVSGGAYAAFTVLMTLLSGIGLLAIYGTLRRVTRAPLAALGLYVPCVATGFFIEGGEVVARYEPGNYFGVFPLRYVGPYVLAWLTARYVDGGRAGRFAPELLFTAAGLVALNNLDFGLPALAASVIAVAATRRRDEPWKRLALGLVRGLVAALALVSILTLLRDGTLPHLELLTRYGRVFVAGGYGNIALPKFGVHIIITLTFIAALAAAAVRVATSDHDVVLTAMLAWTGIFGLGASVYYYVYRSHPDVLLNLFSIWSVTVAMLVIVTVRALRMRRRWATVSSIVVLFAFGLAICSIAQLPLPWDQVRRIAERSSVQPFRLSGMRDVVMGHTHRGERVVVFTPVGHRVAHDAGVVNVSPYTGLGQMPAKEQLDETLAMLKDEGGTKVFLGEEAGFDFESELARRGYARVQTWSDPIGWGGRQVQEFEQRGR